MEFIRKINMAPDFLNIFGKSIYVLLRIMKNYRNGLMEEEMEKFLGKMIAILFLLFFFFYQ